MPQAADEEEAVTARSGRRSSQVKLFVPAAIGAAALAALVMFLVLREDAPPQANRPAPAAIPTDAAASIAVTPLAKAELAKLRQECLDFAKTHYWKELEECSERLKPHEPRLAEKLWKTADDEAANEKKWNGVRDYIEKGELGRARDLVKRIGEGSVYTERAHKALADAEAATRSPGSP